MHIIIVGGGQTGSYLASLLSSDDRSISVVEHRQTQVERLQQIGNHQIVCGNASDATTLEKAGILNADVIIAVTGKDEVNLVVSLLAKMEYNVDRVIARVNNPKNSWLFTPAMGVDVGINQADILARFVQEGLNLNDVYTLMRLGLGTQEHAIVQIDIHPGSQVAGRMIKDVSLPPQTILIAIERAGEIQIPNGNTTLTEGDAIIAFTDTAGRKSLQQIFI